MAQNPVSVEGRILKEQILEALKAKIPVVLSPREVSSAKQPFEPELILIPAGEFLMGSDPQQDNDTLDEEQPQHRLYLPDYYLAKTPVTNGQYRAFVAETDHEAPEGWTNRAPTRGKEDHPVVNVSWYDARDYCRWLSNVTGRGYALPSEAEWEKGARGTDGRIYPWGSQWEATRCNSDESNLGKTTSVSAYPQGATPYGALDMAGNVCEWTRSLWGTKTERPDYCYPYTPTDGREHPDAGREVWRVLRGGSFSGSGHRDLRVCLSLQGRPAHPIQRHRDSGGGAPRFLAVEALASDPLVSGGRGSPEGFSPLVVRGYGGQGTDMALWGLISGIDRPAAQHAGDAQAAALSPTHCKDCPLLHAC